MSEQQKPGRNDPCYCGSGKKYKKCHQPIDQAAERTERDWKEAARFLRGDIVDFAEDEAFAVPFARALPLFWNELYTIDNAAEMAGDEGQIFFDWFAFDYELEDGSRVIEQYRQENWDDLSTPQQETLEKWLTADPLTGYELLDYEGQTLHVRDILTGAEHQVFEPGGRGVLEAGDVLLARIVPVQDHLEFSTAAPYIPQEEVADLVEKLQAAKAAYLETYPEASHVQFLRANNYLFAHHALEQAEKAGRPPVARLDSNRADKIAQKITQRFTRGRR